MKLNFQRVVIILRGCSGASKSTFADYLRYTSVDSPVICTADDYFMVNGEYKFDATKLGEAHSQCRFKFEQALLDEKELVIVANTSTTTKEIQPYLDLAAAKGYTVFSVVMENRHGGKDSHNVPEQTLISQETKLRNSLKLR